MASNSQSTAVTLLNQKQVAELLQMAESTLEDWRVKGEGPPFTKLGFARNAPIRYKLTDIEAWVATLPRITPISQNVDAAYDRQTTTR